MQDYRKRYYTNAEIVDNPHGMYKIIMCINKYILFHCYIHVQQESVGHPVTQHTHTNLVVLWIKLLNLNLSISHYLYT